MKSRVIPCNSSALRVEVSKRTVAMVIGYMLVMTKYGLTTLGVSCNIHLLTVVNEYHCFEVWLHLND